MPEFKRKALEGVFALTPLCLKEDQEIDYEGIRWNIEWLEEKGVHGFIQFGERGQMNAPSEEEFNKVCDVCVDASKDKKIACVVSSTATNTKEAIRRARYAEDAGADGSMLMLPYAFPVTEEWAVEFYQMVDEALKGELAIMLYNSPDSTGFSVTPGAWKKHLLKINSIKAVKDSNLSLAHHDETLMDIADKVNWFSVPDSSFWHDSMLGAKGILGMFVWVAPRAVVRYYEECRKGNQRDPWTLGIHKALTNVFGALKRGLITPPLRYESYQQGNHNALVEIGGAKAGPPRKPYGRYPKEARKSLEELVQPLLEMEKEMGTG